MNVFKQKIEFDFIDVSKVNIELVVTKEESHLIFVRQRQIIGMI